MTLKSSQWSGFWKGLNLTEAGADMTAASGLLSVMEVQNRKMNPFCCYFKSLISTGDINRVKARGGCQTIRPSLSLVWSGWPGGRDVYCWPAEGGVSLIPLHQRMDGLGACQNMSAASFGVEWGPETPLTFQNDPTQTLMKPCSGIWNAHLFRWSDACLLGF